MLTEQRPGQEQRPSLQALIQGKGFSEIMRCGWRVCRETILRQTAYTDWIGGGIQEQKKTALETSPNTSPPREVERQNQEALERITRISEAYQKSFPRQSDYNVMAWQDRGKKLFFQARKRFPPEAKVTRLYLHVPSRTAPEAFRSLCQASAKNDAINEAQIV